MQSGRRNGSSDAAAAQAGGTGGPGRIGWSLVGEPRGEGLQITPGQGPVRRRAGAAFGQHSAQEGPDADIDAGQLPTRGPFGQVYVRGPHHLHPIHVDELVVQYVPGQENLAVLASRLGGRRPRKAHLDLRLGQRHVSGCDRGQPAPDAYQNPGDWRMRNAAFPTYDDVTHPSHPGTSGINNRAADQVDQGEQLPGQGQPNRLAISPHGTGAGQPASSRSRCRTVRKCFPFRGHAYSSK